MTEELKFYFDFTVINLKLKLIIQLLGKLLSMFGTTWGYEATSSTVHFMKSKYRSSIFNENLDELRCSVTKIIYQTQRLRTKKESKIFYY